MKTIHLHIGTHKTGTTSLQDYLWDRRHDLRRQGFALYEGLDNPNNHVELHLASLRYERESFAKIRRPNQVFDRRYTEAVAARVQEFIAGCGAPNVIFSNESLSHLRHRDEVGRLLEVLGCDPAQVRVIVYLRDKHDYLRSYRAQMQKRGRAPSKDFWSALYVEQDTWLTDFESMLSLYEGIFGKERMVVLDYDELMATGGNVIPSFLEVLGLVPDEEEIASYFANRTLSRNSVGRRFKQFRRGLKARLVSLVS